MKEYTIKNTQGEIIYSGEYTSFKACVQDAVLKNTDLSHADLKGANIVGADLSYANLDGVDFTDANFWGADLSGADLRGADLIRASLWDANLNNAYLEDVYLRDAIGIKSYGPVGEYDRDIYAVKHNDCVMFKIGCFWDTYEKALEAVGSKYGMDSEYYEVIKKLNLEVSKEK